MINELQQDRAIAYILSDLTPGESAGFARELAQNPELAAFVAELEETAVRLVDLVPPQMPSSKLRTVILTSVALPRRIASEASRSWWADFFTPKAICLESFALLALILIIGLAANNLHIRHQLAQARHALDDLHQKQVVLQQQTEEQAQLAQQQLGILEKQNALDRLEIATLAAQSPAYKDSQVVIIWNASTQQGRVDLNHLPAAQPGKDYQLWVIDSTYPAPISAGVLALKNSAKDQSVFTPIQPIHNASKFAISLEQSGGAPKPTGPILFLGN